MKNPYLNPALQSLAAGDPVVTTAFGLERRITSGAPVPPDTFLWDERLGLRGDGTATLKVRRSVADISGQPIGDFQITVPSSVVPEFAHLLRVAELDAPRSFRVEPGDTMIKLTIVGGGMSQLNTFGLREPDALAPVKPLLARLDKLAAEVRRVPLAALELRLEPMNTVFQDETQLTITGSLINRGTKGYWILHPAKLSQAGADPLSTESFSFSYGRYDKPQPGETPLPVNFQHSVLTPLQRDDSPFLWVPPGAVVHSQFVARPSFTASGNHVCKLALSTYQGEDTIGNQPRMRGAVFSNEIFLNVR